MVKKVSPVGQTLGDFLQEETLHDEAELEARLRVLAWQIEQQRVARKMTKAKLAARMKTSRSQLDRVLEPKGAAMTVESLDRAARAVGLKLNLTLDAA